MKSFKNDVSVASGLALRGIKIFLSDKMSVFFSLLAPITHHHPYALRAFFG